MRQRGRQQQAFSPLCNWIGEPVHKRGPVACVLFLSHFLSMGKRTAECGTDFSRDFYFLRS